MRAPHFRYVADPVCLASAALYLVGRWVLRPHHIGGAFTAGYLNDVLCLPLFVPPILWAQRRLRLRRHDRPPRLWEILQHWLIFSIVFEVVLPRFPRQFHTTADPLDVLAYLGGGIAAWLIWTRPGTLPRLSSHGFSAFSTRAAPGSCPLVIPPDADRRDTPRATARAYSASSSSA